MSLDLNASPASDTSLAARFAALRSEQPNLRVRNAASVLGVSELELLGVDPDNEVVRLHVPAATIVPRIEELGRVMALTRNEAFVHERYGTYSDVSFDGNTGLVVGPDIDLRIFAHAWKHTVAVTTRERRGNRLSLQFFDAHGVAVHKVFLGAESNEAGFHRLVEAYRHPDPVSAITVEPPRTPTVDAPDAEIDVAGFREAWTSMTDTHEFFGITRKFGVGRMQALRLAPEGFARPLATSALRGVLDRSAAESLPIMVFVNSPGCIQIHTGAVNRLVATGDWYNVLDPDFNLHANEPAIAHAWHVRKPTVDGDVHSVELFDRNGQLLCLLFGERKPGKPELAAWRELVHSLA